MTTTELPLSQFNFAQTFYIDAGAVKNAPEVSITSVGVYVKKKPEVTGQVSGINRAGITIYLTNVTSNGSEEVPNTSSAIFGAVGRIEYDNALVSDTAAVESIATLQFPVTIKTNKSYAIIVKFDGDEDYELWTSVEGHILVGTESTTAGPSGKYIGKYFEFTDSGDNGTLRSLTTTDLKFNVYCAKYQSDIYANTTVIDSNGDEVVNVIGSRSYLLYKDPYEFFTYDKATSSNTVNLIGGELVYQENVIQPDTISVSFGSNTVSTQNANFSEIFGSPSNDRYILVTSGTQKNVRKVTDITSNTMLTVDIPLTISNGQAQFSKVVAGYIDFAAKTLAFGKYQDGLVLNGSNANSTLRFTNNTVESITINAGGTGYTNGDSVIVTNGGSNGSAIISTNANGTITSVRLIEKGYGFLEAPSYTYLKVNGDPATGTGANLVATIGSTLKTEFSNATFANAVLVNAPVASVFVGAVDVENPYGTTVSFKNHYIYSSIVDGIADVAINAAGTGYTNNTPVSFANTTGDGAVALIRTDSTGKIVDVNTVTSGLGYGPGTTVSVTGGTGANLSPVIGVHKSSQNQDINEHAFELFERHNLPASNTPIIISRSYEVTQPEVTITTSTGLSVNTNISSVVEMIITSNNEYMSADVTSGEVDVFYEKNLINNTYENEHTSSGEALSKHISTPVSFGSNKLAEDIRVFIDAYRPTGTDIKVYAKVHNSNDPESFSSKDWTLLELKSINGNYYSALGNDNDLIEFEYGFFSSPNTSVVDAGSIITTLNSANVTGSNTAFSTNFAPNDLVKIYSPLFPTNYMIDVVETVANNTHLALRNQVSNNNVVGTGLTIEKLGFKHQAFNNGLKDNMSRYYNSGMTEFDGYNTFAVKIVLLSDNEFVVPFVDVTKAVGVTA